MGLDDSPLILFFRNFSTQAISYFVTVTLIYFFVWKLGANFLRSYRIPTKRSTNSKQIRREITNTLITLSFAAVQATCVALLYKKGWTLLSTDRHQFGLPAMALMVVGLIALNDIWFYTCHRLLHHPKIFKHIHAVHHQSIDVNPYTSYSFHGLEGMIISAWVIPVVMTIPLYIPIFGVVQFVGLANNIMSHMGYEFLPKWLLKIPGLRLINTATFHSMHHTQFNGNYGLFSRIWDRIFGTEIPGYETTFLQKNSVPKTVPIQSACVTRVVKESHTTTSIYLQVPQGIFKSNPGQFIQILWQGEKRSYSISHGDMLRITIKRTPNGKVSGSLIDNCKVGSKLAFKGPFGEFGNNLPTQGRILFVAGGSGITPFGSLVPAALRRALHVRLLMINRSRQDSPLLDEFRLQNGLDLVTHFDEENGILHPDLLSTYLGEKPVGVWLCGSKSLCSLVRTVSQKQWSDVPIFQEQFVNMHQGSLDKCSVAIVDRHGHRSLIVVEPGESILVAARNHSIDLPAGCEQGACGTCKILVVQGQMETPTTSCLSDIDRAKGFALACVAKPSNGVVVSTLDQIPEKI